MNKLTDYYELNNGVQIPCVGFGTWQAPDGAVAVSAVKEAIASGYRHIDTAAIYGNEESIGKAIQESSINRKELFLTTKVWNDDHGYEATLNAVEVSMKKLNTDYLDLYLVHWPNPIKFRNHFEEINAETWRAMETIYESGKARAIGISNYMPHHLDILLKTAKIIPAVNQIRLYPGFTNEDAVKASRDKNILLQAYSPFGTGNLISAPELMAIASKYKKSVAQICLRWSLQLGFLPLPKSVTASRIRENSDIFDFELSNEDVAYLKQVKNYGKPASDPDQVPF